MFEAVFKGLILGFGISLITGTTFVALLNIALFKGLKPAILFAFGVFLSDLIIFLTIYLGFATFYQDQKIRNLLSILGGVLILLYGISLFFKPKIKLNYTKNNQPLWSSILQGLFINLFNPLVFVFWFAISSLISQTSKPLFTSLIALFTMLTIDIFKSYGIVKFRNNYST